MVPLTMIREVKEIIVEEEAHGAEEAEVITKNHDTLATTEEREEIRVI